MKLYLVNKIYYENLLTYFIFLLADNLILLQ
jgi:hypothetical protein